MKMKGRRQSTNIQNAADRDPTEIARADAAYLNRNNTFAGEMDKALANDIQQKIRTEVNTEEGFADYVTQRRMEKRERRTPDFTQPFGARNKPKYRGDVGW